MGRFLRRFARACLWAALAVVVAVGALVATLQTAWGQDHLRRLIVAQAGRVLAADLEIDTFRGSLASHLEIGGIRLSQNNQTLVSIERVDLTYGIRELFEGGTRLRQIRLVKPRFVVERQADGRWNLAALLRQRAGPRPPSTRRITIDHLDIVDGFVVVRDPPAPGGLHVPGRYERLNTSLGVSTRPGAWNVAVASASWIGGASDLTVDRIEGGISSDAQGIRFDALHVATPQGALTLDGRVRRGGAPAELELAVSAERFLFQEWGVVVPALSRIPIDSRFTARTSGPLSALKVDLDFHSNGGDARGPVVLDTSVPGWMGRGVLALTRLDLARWFASDAQRSDISGTADFDLALQLGRGVPRGRVTFAGPRVEYMGYRGANVRVRADLTARECRIASATMLAYGAQVALARSTIALRSPYAFRFIGTARGLDLTALPATVPVPHVDSQLAMAFDAGGQFVRPFIAGRAEFDTSTFIGAHVEAGTTGTIDTSVSPVGYTGEGTVSNVDLNRFGAALGVAWLSDPAYAGIVSGQFHVTGEGFDTAALALDAGGRITRADIFNGEFRDADVALHIDAGSLDASYDGAFTRVDPSVVFGDERLAASLTGAGRLRVVAPGFFERALTLDEYDITGDVSFGASTLGMFALDAGTFAGALRAGLVTVTTLQARGAAFDADVSGRVALDAESSDADVSYVIRRADLAQFTDWTGGATGLLSTTGRLSGPRAALHVVGDAAIERLAASGASAAAATGRYDVTFPWETPADAAGQLVARFADVAVGGQLLSDVSGTATYDRRATTLDLALSRSDGLTGAVALAATLRDGERAIDLDRLRLSTSDLAWDLQPSTPSPIVSWDQAGIRLTPVVLTDVRNPSQRVNLSGDWRPDGGGALRLTATELSLDRLLSTPERPALFGGLLAVDATLAGGTERPVLSSQISVTDGRVRRVGYEKLAGRIDYAEGMLQVALQLDQAPGIWLTAEGRVPMTVLDRTAPEQPIDLTLVSSDVDLTLVEGLTAFVRDVTGRLRGTLHISGTNRAPTLIGAVNASDAAFTLTSTGARFRNGSATFDLASDRINVSAFHLEDRNGRPLDIRGSLGTSELRVGDVEVDITARRFEVVRNATGNTQVDANLKVRGTFDAPRLFGDVTVVGGELKVDEVMARAFYQPYGTGPSTAAAPDALSALDPWERLSLDVAVHSQNALRMTGENLAVTSDTPLGLGSFNLRASGDIFLYKQPADVLSVTGSLDSISGSYAFQGRRFELYPSSSIDFRGDLNPSLFISVSRVISGIEARVTISGTLLAPEIQLSSTPPLDPSDILSLIVFNTSVNDLTASQTTNLAERASLLAAGFVSNSLTSALERSIGLDLLEVAPTTGTGGASNTKVTVGEEIAPGLVARFSRQFGAEQYDEATLEYFISRILRLRATFSDSQGAVAATRFRRAAERTGVDLLLLFSF